MTQEWRNWSGSLRFTPGRVEEPENEDELAELVSSAGRERRTVRVAGAGHSSMPLLATDHTLVSLAKFKGLVSHDTAGNEATVRAGMTLREAGQHLFEAGLALHNLGDVDTQTLVGAIGTGTHGTGRRLKDLSSALIGVRLVTGEGEIAEYSLETDPEFMKAARLSLGTLGIFTALRLKLVPAYRLHRREWCTGIDECLEHLGELIEGNRNFDFYWYPRSDEVRLRTLNPVGQGEEGLPYGRLVQEKTGWSAEVIPKSRHLKFDEMEYAVPAQAGLDCFLQVRRRIKERHRRLVGWRVLYRTIAADDTYLSNEYGRDSVTISLHHNAGLPFWEFFKDIEPIFRAYGGRPHWGKKHTLKAEELRALYPMWDRFAQARRRIDPEGVFLNPYLRELLGTEGVGRKAA
jgi:FAD/FMN-containing dehydrogenase